MLGADHPRHPRGQVGLVLEEVQVAPRLGLGVLDLAALRGALRARERGAPLEVQAQLEASLIAIKGALNDAPWRHEPERLLEEIDIAHRRILADPDPPPRYGSPTVLPTRFSEEPTNSQGQLGNSSAASSYVPIAVSTSGALNGNAIRQVSVGGYHGCAVANGKAFCWGYNIYGQLGNGSTTQSNVPVAVSTSGPLNGKTVSDISSGDYYTCTVASAKAYCWGQNTYGMLGNGGTSTATSPVAVNTSGVLSGKSVTSVATSANHSCALANGSAYCWGYNGSGQLGNSSATTSYVPVAVNTGGVLSGRSVTAISTGGYYTCGVADGRAYCWGQNNYGQLGNGSTTNSTVPVAVYAGGVLSGKTVTGISAGNYHTCAIADQKAYCWGYNVEGQLGNNSTTTSTVPVAVYAGGVMSGKTVTGVSAASAFYYTNHYYTCAVADGAPYCWGYNGAGQLGNGTTANSAVPVAASPFPSG